jgi:hypothetical protein
VLGDRGALGCGGPADKIGLPETIEAVRTELRNAIAQAEGQGLQFPVGGCNLSSTSASPERPQARAGSRYRC